MQTTVRFDASLVDQLATSVFESEQPLMASAYSEYGQPLQRFITAEEMKTYVACCMSEDVPFFSFAIWYPSARGHVEEQRVSLDPRLCKGHTFRYSVGGWGVIQLQFDFRQNPDIECTVTVNSKKRASLWQPHYPEFGPVSAWDWKAVEKNARRLIRKIRALAQQGAPADRSKAALLPVR